MEALVILSGGQDSTTCLLWALDKGYKVKAITFAYSQRHDVEIACARMICAKYSVEHTVIDISFFGLLSKFSSLTNKDIKIGHDRDDNLPNSFVPNRNQLFFTLAHSIAVNSNIDTLIMGVNEADYSGYPDCRKPFLNKLLEITNLGSNANIKLEYPLISMRKSDIFYLAHTLGGIDDIIELTHTCYSGGRTKNEWGYGCGECPSCEIRKNGFYEYKRKIVEGL